MTTCPDCGTEIVYRACARGASPTEADLAALDEIAVAAHKHMGGCTPMTIDDDPLLDRCQFRGGPCPDHAHAYRPGICPSPPAAVTADWTPDEEDPDDE